jgi:hypothetical protein
MLPLIDDILLEGSSSRLGEPGSEQGAVLYSRYETLIARNGMILSLYRRLYKVFRCCAKIQDTRLLYLSLAWYFTLFHDLPSATYHLMKSCNDFDLTTWRSYLQRFEDLSCGSSNWIYSWLPSCPIASSSPPCYFISLFTYLNYIIIKTKYHYYNKLIMEKT